MSETMSFNDDDDAGEVIVNLTGSTTEPAATVAKTTEKPTVKTDDDGDPLEDLKAQFNTISGRLSSTEAAHQQTQQELQRTQQTLQRTQQQVVSSQLDTVVSGISAAEAEAAAAEQTYVAAMEAGDHMAAARAQRAMTAAEARKVRLQEAKDDLEEAAKAQPTRRQEPHQQPSQPRQPADPVEAVASQLSARSAAWVRAHPECITDKKMNARMMAAHNLALADDIPVDSDEYFKRIEAGIKTAKAEPAAKPQGDGRRPSSAAASATGAGGNGGVLEVKLTKREAQSAQDGTLVWNYDDPSGQKRFRKGDPIGLAEMARRKHEGMKAGLYDKNSFEA